ENNQASIKSIESSAQFEQSNGAKGEYYFCTGALRADMGGDPATVASLQRAVSNYGATIGSHNGGLPNPVNLSLTELAYDYWHWGPDEVLDITPPGYANGQAYANASILASFKDIEGWLSGLDNGRAGCGAAGNCPRTWVSPYFNSTREGSREIIDQLGAITMGEQKIGPFPHRTLSYDTPGKYYSSISLPVSEWFIGNSIAQTLDGNDGEALYAVSDIDNAIDFYYGLGALINFYGHQPSNVLAAAQENVIHSLSKPNIWSTNSVGIHDWWLLRSNVVAAPTVTSTGNIYTVTASVSGATDPGTAIEIALPQNQSNMSVFLNGTLAGPSAYRFTNYGSLKVQVGNSVSSVQVQYALPTPPMAVNDAYSTNQNTALSVVAPGVLSNDTDPQGKALTAQLVSGPSHGTLTLNSNGSFTYTPSSNYTGSDSFTYQANDGSLTSGIATVAITIVPVGSSPVAVNDSYSANQGTPLTVVAPGVLSNDTDPQGKALTAQLVSGPDNGTLTLNTDGSFTYTPVTNYVGNDSFTYQANDGTANSNIATVSITVTSTAGVLFSDYFTPAPGAPNPLSPWVGVAGTWAVANGVMQGSGTASNYANIYTSTTPLWTDYSVEGIIQFPAGAFGGGIGGRVNPATGAHYGAWVYPDGSMGGSNVLKLIKFSNWTTWSYTPMQQVSLPSVGTGWHDLKLVFNGSEIQVYYDGTLMIDVTDNNFDSTAPYLSGGISGDMWTYTTSYVMGLKNIAVQALP
ncbi:MAG TPA: cadherin-like domain-containing protein, partial [Nitrospirota bacterium]|nr:cadherin-like domain-containing protein [Nitrospirota bacterium]